MDGYPQVALRFLFEVLALVKGKKSIKTIIAEEQFKAIIKAIGGEYKYEYVFFKKPSESYLTRHPNKIDFVVSLKHRDGGMSYRSFAGVELKTSLYDLRGAYGKNFSSFCYNYLLITEDISARAVQYMESIEEYKHVGILILCGDGELIINRAAKPLLSDDKNFDISYLSAIEDSEEELLDSIKLLLNYKRSEYIRWLVEREREIKNGKTDKQ